MQVNRSHKFCLFFNTKKGCRKQESCRFRHLPFGECQFGKHCRNPMCTRRHPPTMPLPMPQMMPLPLPMPMPVQHKPLTSEMLRAVKPAEKKRLIGERLFPKIQIVEPLLAGKITGMLLENKDNAQLLGLLSDERALMNNINEALAVLKDYQQKQEGK